MSEALWTSAEAAAATGGVARGDWRALGVSIDSRTLAPGDLFVALRGPTFDGHAFVADALAKGAAAALVDEPPRELGPTAPLLVVADTIQALRALARAARARTAARVIGVTGSVGKTSIKEALRLVLAEQGPTHASAGSLNNHWGLPLSLARLPRDAAFAVFEMGMNHAGEIAPLTRLARPHVAVITTVEGVHRGNFPSVEAIADAKAEIFLGIEPGGIAVLNRDNPFFERLVHAARAAGIARVLGFGEDQRAEARLLAATCEADGSSVRADLLGEVLDYRVGAAGRHWVLNSLCVLAAVKAAGADVRDAARRLAAYGLPKGRGQRVTVQAAFGAFELIDDSYNASPPSMLASFDVLARVQPRASGRRVAVLGDMLELGDGAEAAHAGLAEGLCRHGIDVVFTAGPLMARLHEALPPAVRGAHAKDAASLAPVVMAAVRAGDVVAVKGSAGSRMGQVVTALRTLAVAEDADRGEAA